MESGGSKARDLLAEIEAFDEDGWELVFKDFEGS
jgi:hypothetical protein